MKAIRLTSIAGATAVVVALVVQSAGARTDQQAAPRSASAGHQCLVMTGSGDPAFTRNFNPYTAQSSPSGGFVRGAMYEPLIVTTAAGGGHQYPWLAKSWKWTNGNKTLNLSLQQGVKWSDGKPLTSADVVYSLTAGNQDKLMDVIGLTRPGNNIASVKATGAYGVRITLNTPDSQFIASNLNGIYVVPKHVFSQQTDIANWTNPNPVGSGPFTKVTRFTTQDYVLSKNPNYWQKGSPKIPCIEYVQAASNDAALLLIQSGQVDWTHNFVPNVAQAYSAKDKSHFHSFYATTAYPISLMLDTTQYPFSLVPLRKAISMAIDRSTVSKLGEYGYAPPTDAIGLNGIYPQWLKDPSAKAEAKKLSTYNPAAAKTLLTQNGFTYKGNQLVDPKGDPVSFQIHVISGWSDWVASLQIISKNLQGIGIDANVKLEPDWNAWYPNASSTKTPTLLWQNGATGSPYGFFYANMHENAFTPAGADGTTTGNWVHFKSSTATSLLNQWKVTLSPEKQQQLATQLQKVWLDQLPIVPLFIGPRWSTYSTKYFHCFSSPKNYYGDPIFTTFPDNVLSFTRICPGGQAGA
jgi:peptide/nickel transport system substrate-binding protein